MIAAPVAMIVVNPTKTTSLSSTRQGDLEQSRRYVVLLGEIDSCICLGMKFA